MSKVVAVLMFVALAVITLGAAGGVIWYEQQQRTEIKSTFAALEEQVNALGRACTKSSEGSRCSC